MREEHRRQSIHLKLARMSSRESEFLPTGFASLDRALGGGLPRGRISELFGPEGSGKTTLALQFSAAAQRSGAGAAWIDAEHTFDANYAASLGVDIARLPVMQPGSAEQALEMARSLAASGALDLLVIDSAAALAPALELESGLGEAGPGLQSRVLASGLRRLTHAAARSGICVVFLNQMRVRRDVSGEDRETTAGGAALKLESWARIAISPVTGRRLRFRILKNKASGAFAGGSLEWKDGLGFAESL
jgi:recombination protein RecA